MFQQNKGKHCFILLNIDINISRYTVEPQWSDADVSPPFHPQDFIFWIAVSHSFLYINMLK